MTEMTVTEVEPISKTRSRVYVDGTAAFILYKGELRKYQIREGGELTEDVWQELQTEVLPKRARLRAMNLLKGRQYTQRQLMDKLLLGGYSQEMAQEAVDYVKSYHYVDDARYAYDYISCRMGSHSLKEIEQKLLQKGVCREVIRSAVEELAGDGFVSDEEAMIRRLLEKKHYSSEHASEKERQRMYGYLYRKGFSMDTARRVMEEMD
ncbi:regulatory protein RecX [Lachnospiraceae bacterium JLR.KK008]